MTGWKSASSDYTAPRSPGERDAWSQEAARLDRKGSNTLREVTEVAPTAEVASALGLEPGGVAVVRRRIVLLDDQPIELADSYYPVSVARGTALAETRKIRGGAVTLLAELGFSIAKVTEDITTRMPTAEERELLRMDVGEPVLIQLRRSADRDDVPLEVSLMTMIGNGRTLRYEVET